MMAVWHLLYIVPLAGTLGFFAAALLGVGREH